MINQLTGIKPHKQQTCNLLSEFNIMEFTGNQHNEDWVWNIKTLNELSENELKLLYNSIYDENHYGISFNYLIHLPQRYVDLYEYKIKAIREKENTKNNLRKMLRR